MLSVYVREMSRPKLSRPNPRQTQKMFKRSRNGQNRLTVDRTDLENAVQTLGRLETDGKLDPDKDIRSISKPPISKPSGWKAPT